MTFWTEERVERLRELAPTHSAGEIGKDLGTTRNAVIGKSGRMGIPLAKATQPAKPRTRFIRPRPRPPAPPPPEMPRPARAEPAGAFRQGKGCRIAELTKNACRWPLWGETTPVLDRRYCGRQVDRGLPYCSDHCREAYQR